MHARSSTNFPAPALASFKPTRQKTLLSRPPIAPHTRARHPRDALFRCLIVRRPSYRSASHEARTAMILPIARFHRSPPISSCTGALARQNVRSAALHLVQMTPLCAAHCRPPVLPASCCSLTTARACREHCSGVHTLFASNEPTSKTLLRGSRVA